jgi:hypothetical protein
MCVVDPLVENILFTIHPKTIRCNHVLVDMHAHPLSMDTDCYTLDTKPVHADDGPGCVPLVVQGFPCCSAFLMFRLVSIIIIHLSLYLLLYLPTIDNSHLCRPISRLGTSLQSQDLRRENLDVQPTPLHFARFTILPRHIVISFEQLNT